MSLPTFPVMEPGMDIEDSLSMILASIAMEESALSRIIDAESEKLQYVLGLLDKSLDKKATVEEILAVNKSVKDLIDSVAHNQFILKKKMECAVEALEGHCIIGPTGPTGPVGPKGEPGSPGACCAVSFLGIPDQCWDDNKPLIWVNSECSCCRAIRLSSDRRKIALERCGCYVISFTIDMCVTQRRGKYVSVSLQTNDGMRKSERFICHFPIIYEDVPFTASASGIFIPTQTRTAELTLTLVTPQYVKVAQSSISVMEI